MSDGSKHVYNAGSARIVTRRAGVLCRDVVVELMGRYKGRGSGRSRDPDSVDVGEASPLGVCYGTTLRRVRNPVRRGIDGPAVG